MIKVESSLREDILNQLARNNILGENFVNVNGWEICLSDGGLTANSFSFDVFKVITIDELSKNSNFMFLYDLLEFKDKKCMCILELDLDNLPFESFSYLNIYNQLKRFKSLRDDVLLVLIVRNLKELEYEFCFKVYFDIIYLPDTENILYSFNTNLQDLKCLIAPNLSSSIDNFDNLLSNELFYVYCKDSFVFSPFMDDSSLAKFYNNGFHNLYFLDILDEIGEKINLLNNIDMNKLIGDVFDDKR